MEKNETYPYYYIDTNNKIKIVNVTHFSEGSNKGIKINKENKLNSSSLPSTLLSNIKYYCGDEPSFENNIFSFENEYKIKIPISSNENIVLKSMADVDIQRKQSNDKICSIFDESIKIAKPYQVNK